jgi:hypothetical protein
MMMMMSLVRGIGITKESPMSRGVGGTYNICGKYMENIAGDGFIVMIGPYPRPFGHVTDLVRTVAGDELGM